jgi:hypothetical protein
LRIARSNCASAPTSSRRAWRTRPSRYRATGSYGSSAIAQFDLAIRNGQTCPAPILGNAHLEAAHLHERLGHKDDAVSGYRIASTLFGAAADTRAAATRALARLDIQ